MFTTGPLHYKGQPTGVIFGFLNQLFTIAQQTRPDQIVFAWDSRKSKRRLRYPFYKVRNKDRNDEDLQAAFAQFIKLRTSILPKLGFLNNVLSTGYEADDIIAKVAEDNTRVHITIVSSDADLYQLLNRTTEIYNPNKKSVYTDKDFQQEYGIQPKQWAEVKSIAGCATDKVPGVYGVAETTAVNFLKGNLKKNSLKRKMIQENSSIIERNRWLVTLPLPGTPPVTLKQNKFNVAELQKLCKELNFKSYRLRVDDWGIFF